MRKSSLIVGAGLSQYSDDPDMYEFLVSYSDGREIGYQLPKDVAVRIAKDMAYEFSSELDAAKAEA